MQVPEKLALIGGSILLSSTLIFTLKSQASQILPKINDTSSKIFDHISDAQKASDFDNSFKQAQKNGETTGQWGTAKYYIDSQSNMHVGQGQLNGKLYDILGSNKLSHLNTLNFDEHVKAPSNSFSLLAGNNNVYRTQVTDSASGLTAINGINNLDTSNTTNMVGMFANNNNLKRIDVSSLNTSKTTDMGLMFHQDQKLTNINVNNWDTSHVQHAGAMFSNTFALTNIDLSHWNVNNLSDTGYMFESDGSLKSINLNGWNNSNDHHMYMMMINNGSLKSVTLGSNTRIQPWSGMNGGTWKNGSQTISDTTIQNGEVHPGTWIHQ